MINRVFDITVNGKKQTIERINKKTARNRFAQGETIYIYPSNMNPCSMWTSPYIIHTDYMRDAEDFDNIVTYFEIYNCDNWCGKYASFYIAK